LTFFSEVGGPRFLYNNAGTNPSLKTQQEHLLKSSDLNVHPGEEVGVEFGGFTETDAELGEACHGIVLVNSPLR
jgi:hypothetical protein